MCLLKHMTCGGVLKQKSLCPKLVITSHMTWLYLTLVHAHYYLVCALLEYVYKLPVTCSYFIKFLIL